MLRTPNHNTMDTSKFVPDQDKLRFSVSTQCQTKFANKGKKNIMTSMKLYLLIQVAFAKIAPTFKKPDEVPSTKFSKHILIQSKCEWLRLHISMFLNNTKSLILFSIDTYNTLASYHKICITHKFNWISSVCYQYSWGLNGDHEILPLNDYFQK